MTSESMVNAQGYIAIHNDSISTFGWSYQQEVRLKKYRRQIIRNLKKGTIEGLKTGQHKDINVCA